MNEEYYKKLIEMCCELRSCNLDFSPTAKVNIYDVAPEFSHCFVFECTMYFAKGEVVTELEDMGIKVFIRKNFLDTSEVRNG